MTSFQSGYVSTPQFSHDGSHMHAGMVSGAPQASAVPQPITAQEAIEVAGRNIEKMIHITDIDYFDFFLPSFESIALESIMFFEYFLNTLNIIYKIIVQ